MPRARRSISADGYLVCTKCKATLHIDEFYTSSTGAWFVLDAKYTEAGTMDIVYGKPNSWCKECMRAHQRTSTANVTPAILPPISRT